MKTMTDNEFSLKRAETIYNHRFIRYKKILLETLDEKKRYEAAKESLEYWVAVVEDERSGK